MKFRLRVGVAVLVALALLGLCAYYGIGMWLMLPMALGVTVLGWRKVGMLRRRARHFKQCWQRSDDARRSVAELLRHCKRQLSEAHPAYSVPFRQPLDDLERLLVPTFRLYDRKAKHRLKLYYKSWIRSVWQAGDYAEYFSAVEVQLQYLIAQLTPLTPDGLRSRLLDVRDTLCIHARYFAEYEQLFDVRTEAATHRESTQSLQRLIDQWPVTDPQLVTVLEGAVAANDTALIAAGAAAKQLIALDEGGLEEVYRTTSWRIATLKHAGHLRPWARLQWAHRCAVRALRRSTDGRLRPTAAVEVARASLEAVRAVIPPELDAPRHPRGVED